MTTNLERAAQLVQEAIDLIDDHKGLYPNISHALKEAWEEIDSQIDYEDERSYDQTGKHA
jgi:hypothetical protein